MEETQTILVMGMEMVSQNIQMWLRKILLWMIDEEGERTVKKIVNEDSEDDEGYSSIISPAVKEVTNQTRRRRKLREEELNIGEETTKEEITEKFILLREAYDELKDVMTRLEFEVDCFKDDQDEKEEEMRLQRTELLHLVEQMKVMQVEKEGNKNIIRRQQDIIDKWARDHGDSLEDGGEESC